MKNTYKILILLVVLLGLNACHDDPEPLTELEKLPPASQTGADTAGCLLNGKAFLPGTGTPFGIYSIYRFGLEFQISIDRREDDQGIKSVQFSSEAGFLEVGKTYMLGETKSGGKYGEYAEYPPFPLKNRHFNTTAVTTGEFKITFLDEKNGIVAGTFSFDAVERYQKKDTIHVREGRFDIHY